jgi:hypothetical protein
MARMISSPFRREWTPTQKAPLLLQKLEITRRLACLVATSKWLLFSASEVLPLYWDDVLHIVQTNVTRHCGGKKVAPSAITDVVVPVGRWQAEATRPLI